jgi:hypothetical protein
MFGDFFLFHLTGPGIRDLLLRIRCMDWSERLRSKSSMGLSDHCNDTIAV